MPQTLHSSSLHLFDPAGDLRPDNPAAMSGARGRRQASERGRVVPRLRLCVLGSGSGGNSTVVGFDDHAMLIDAGFGPHTTRRRLAQAGVALEQVRAICLTHLDRDHFRPSWIRTLLALGIRIHLHHWHLPELAGIRGVECLFDAGLVEPFDGDAFEPVPGLIARTVRLQHDRQGTLGYRFDAHCTTRSGSNGAASNPGTYGSIAYATDLGHVPRALIDLFAGVDLLCLECNYDEHMTVTSSRPSFVNRRNLSDSGHLSNEQAFDAVQRIAAASPHGNPRHVVLMHRSQQCNHPTKVRRVFERAPFLERRMTLTHQRRRSCWFRIKPLPATRRCQGVLAFPPLAA